MSAYDKLQIYKSMRNVGMITHINISHLYLTIDCVKSSLDSN
jgi:hypothetical protein